MNLCEPANRHAKVAISVVDVKGLGLGTQRPWFPRSQLAAQVGIDPSSPFGLPWGATANCDSNQACLEGGSRPSKCRLPVMATAQSAPQEHCWDDQSQHHRTKYAQHIHICLCVGVDVSLFMIPT